MWVYNTITKVWKRKEDLPFNWHGNLLTCENKGKIFFMGDSNRYQKNIIQIYDTFLDIWEKPIILSQKFISKYMINKNNTFHFLGREINHINDKTILGGNREGIISIYPNMTYKITNLKMNYFDVSFSDMDNYIYVFGNVNKLINYKMNVTRINLNTHTKKNIESIPYPIKNPLSLSYKDNIYLFGGKLEKNKYENCEEFDEDCIFKNNKDKNNGDKVLHHKFIPPKQDKNIDNLILNFKLQN